jgi:hypothetical protein
MTPNGMLLDISVSPNKQKLKERSNRHLILIRLCLFAVLVIALHELLGNPTT